MEILSYAGEIKISLIAIFVAKSSKLSPLARAIVISAAKPDAFDSTPNSFFVIELIPALENLSIAFEAVSI